jgi:hypothetical protein
MLNSKLQHRLADWDGFDATDNPPHPMDAGQRYVTKIEYFNSAFEDPVTADPSDPDIPFSDKVEVFSVSPRPTKLPGPKKWDPVRRPRLGSVKCHDPALNKVQQRLVKPMPKGKTGEHTEEIREERIRQNQEAAMSGDPPVDELQTADCDRSYNTQNQSGMLHAFKL